MIDAAQIFAAIKVIDPGCDKNGDGTIKDEELKCLSYAWKGYLPQWSNYRKDIDLLILIKTILDQIISY